MSKKEEIDNQIPEKPEINTDKGIVEKNKCGIVMPISSIDGCTAEHWTEILSIIKDSIISSGFEPNLVSDADDSGIIQKRIIHNLYSNEIVVCDVSAKNPNVMFELGMRLAFDKPTIIIKDDKTEYTFDTSIIEHITYPRDLRFNKIIAFKDALKKKIIAFDIPVPFRNKIVPKIPFQFFAKTFADAGYSYNKFAGDTRLGNKLLYTGGFGLDMLTLYDINFSFEYSFNQLGQKGLFLHARGGF